MDDSTSERRQAFSFWLRTGRLPVVQTADGYELKFNPWHDWASGRFTFADTGRHSGGSGGGFTGGGGGRFGGGGATGTWKRSDKRPKVQAARPGVSPPSARAGSPGSSGAKVPEAMRTPRVLRMLHQAPAPSARKIDPGATPTPPAAPPQIHRLVRNGYEYRIDDKGRTVGVEGTLTLSVAPIRSRTAQARAGGADRRGTDDGGHYIAVRFNGPTEAFNHFAQDRNFNRGGYRALEDQWAAAAKNGKQVSVTIAPACHGDSNRPAAITVTYSINGVRKKQLLPNERQEKTRGE